MLTDQDDQDEGYRDTPLHRIFVVNLPRYLNTYADPSLAYQAHRLGDGIARIGPLNAQAADRAQAGTAVLEAELDLAQIAAWAADNPERKRQLKELAGSETGDEPNIAEVLAALEGLATGLDADAVAVVGRLFGADSERERRMELIRAITNDPSGRYLTGEVVVERIPQRIADARAAMSAYQELLDDTDTNETEMQTFIEENLWLLGLDYATMRPRQALPVRSHIVVPQTKTVELDADLVERAQREADERGITLKQLVNDALERKLTKEEQALRDQRRRPRPGQGRSTDGLSAANIAVDPVSLPGPPSRAAPPPHD